MLEAKNKKFYLDGKEFRIKSGAFHYFRALPEYWEDILTKIKAAGLNTVETYTCWNLHEPHKGEFDFSGMLDLERFIETADKVGLKVILRTGPFICAEWEAGGLPAWLLKSEYNIRFRCASENYLVHLRDWFKVLLAKIRPHLDTNGGNVIALALENEYGSYGDDFSYLAEVEKIYKENGIDCALISADGHLKYHLSTGRSGPHIIAGTDFGGVAAIDRFENLDIYDKDAPYFTTEYWAGNFTDWGFPRCTYDNVENTAGSMKFFDEVGASFNIYMIFGGTNFGFTNGAQRNLQGGYHPVTTSYDYDAAITEWGGYTERYFAIKGDDKTPVPPSPVLQNIGEVALTKSASLWDNLNIGKNFKSVTVEPMEEFDQNDGFILYRKTVTYDADLSAIKLKGIADRAHVYVNGVLKGIRTRDQDESPVVLEEKLMPGDVIDVLVENMGRICYGEETYKGDRKGITDAIVLARKLPDGSLRNPGKTTFNWDITTLEMKDISPVDYKEGTEAKLPAFFKGTFRAENKNSCFVHFDNFKQGVIWVNGFNLGRYWEIGPLEALYIPGVLLKENEDNEIVIFETDGLRGEPKVTITDKCGIPNHHEEIIVK